MAEGRLAAAPGARRRRLHVMVSPTCNNRCLFCLEDRAARAAADFSAQVRALEAYQSRDAVLFTCGEPTIADRLLDLLAAARRLGYREREVVTNGRRLAYAGYCRSLVDTGLTAATISIHGATARAHDGLTRAPGSFAQAVTGLARLAAVRRAGADLELTTSTVVTRGNLSELAPAVRLFATFGVSRVVLNFVAPVQEALRHYDALVPRMAAAAAAIRAIAVPAGLECRVEGLPPCVLAGRGQLAGAREEITLFVEGALRPLAPTRDQVKGPPCARCALAERCDGVWAEYARRHGWEELTPVDG
ncbi:MAG: radical SAM protein [Deltaproteobacteria bacterium]|nr:radical SAM protein [Deltaproteobacteria bacterium]